MKSVIAAACFLVASSTMAADLGNTSNDADNYLSPMSASQTIERTTTKKHHKKKKHKAQHASGQMQ